MSKYTTHHIVHLLPICYSCALPPDSVYHFCTILSGRTADILEGDVERDPSAFLCNVSESKDAMSWRSMKEMTFERTKRLGRLADKLHKESP
jgi:hypothetical protein